MDLGIRGRKAIICASSRGLGRASAMALAQEGVDVVINGRDKAALEATAAEIRAKTGVNVIAVAADVATADGQDALFAACPQPDILVNNNGGPPFKDFREIDRAAITDGVIQNMVTPIVLIQRAVPGMIERGFGRIVNITSFSVLTPISGLDLSSGARAGLTGFLAGVSRQVAGNGVTINQLLPGFIDTDRYRGGLVKTAEMTGKSADDLHAQRAASVPAKRIGSPEEFGASCAYLCSLQAAYITGQNLLVDGGLVAKAF